MNKCSYSISSAWTNRIETPEAIGGKFLETLASLSQGNPIFQNWGVGDVLESHDLEALENAKIVPLSKISGNISSFVEGHTHFYEDTGQMDPDFGYDLSAFNDFSEDENASPLDLSLHIQAGAKFGNNADFMAGGPWVNPDPSIVTFPIFDLAMRTLIRIWAPTWANAHAGGWNEAAGPIPPAYKALWGQRFLAPWMSYLSAPLAKGVTPPADIHTERTPDGGLLMTATEDPLDPTNPEHMRRARVLADVMLQGVPESAY